MSFRQITAAALCAAAALRASADFEVRRGEEWIPIDYRRDIAPGSVMDFSGMGLQDAPAGKYGWLKNIDGHFEFEGRPGVRQVFYGVNLCKTANFPDHAVADRLVERLVRLGYNTVRIHHHDEAWAAAFAARRQADSNDGGYGGSGARLPSSVDAIDRLDYLLATAISRGLYITTDLYVSRNVNWPRAYYKTSVGHDGAVCADWCAFARGFLEHVNPYTGRAYKDEPGMPLISLVNEGAMTMFWDSLRSMPEIRARWQAWLAERRTEDSARWADVPNDPVETFADGWKGPWSREVCEFAANEERANYECERDFVRSLGAKALLTSVNYYALKKPYHKLRARLFDYADDHFYIDHPNGMDGGPQFGDATTWCPMKNPVAEFPRNAVTSADARVPGLPLVATEWNWCAPSRYRNLAGLVVGVASAVLDRDGMWRFDYSSHADTIDRNWHVTPFQMACDPAALVSDRAMVCLFLRGDEPRPDEKAAMTPDEAIEKTTRLAGFDAETGTLAVETARTCGVGGGPGAERTAGPLAVRIEGARAAVWASVIDGAANLASSSRILLAHLTDVANEGARFTGAEENVWSSYGTPPWVYLARAGRADVTLRLEGIGEARVWALALDGTRKRKIPAEVRNGALCFTADVAGDPDDATFLYEIADERQ